MIQPCRCRNSSPPRIERSVEIQFGKGRVLNVISVCRSVQDVKGVKEQQRLVRGPSAAAGELADAVEPDEQGLAVERYRGAWPIGGWFRHRAKFGLLRTRRKGTHRIGADFPIIWTRRPARLRS